MRIRMVAERAGKWHQAVAAKAAVIARDRGGNGQACRRCRWRHHGKQRRAVREAILA
ncbi:hypothetical protein LP420_19955 [Massilia sp. B-10]|nr:hypothetical protein LP420_19955 [Massilia sp. B-10]